MKAIDLVDDVEFGAFDDERDGQSAVDNDDAIAGADNAEMKRIQFHVTE